MDEQDTGDSKMKCVICEEKILPDLNGWAGGHNPEPLAKGRCCGLCNAEIVIPVRLIAHSLRRDKDEDTRDESRTSR